MCTRWNWHTQVFTCHSHRRGHTVRCHGRQKYVAHRAARRNTIRIQTMIIILKKPLMSSNKAAFGKTRWGLKGACRAVVCLFVSLRWQLSSLNRSVKKLSDGLEVEPICSPCLKLDKVHNCMVPCIYSTRHTKIWMIYFTMTFNPLHKRFFS